ncbi:hypothetical protein [Haliscomenobacter sp.]|uniref:hypothetical protein n=1 Tax=Haliscomenobacter sp. TaxID=2717303 RepID=UPI0035931470
MKKSLLTLIMFCSLGILSMLAQTGTDGISYQAVVRDAQGKVLANAPVSIKIALVSENKSVEAYYTEVHKVSTDFQGQFNIIIGEGQQAKGTIAQVPWGKEQIELNIELIGEKSGVLKIHSRSRLLSVPYAMHAATTSKLSEDQATEKTQSIYWTTTGNSATAPPTHFLGTRDAQDLAIKTNNQTRLTFTKGGQMQIKSGVNGPDTEMSSYPLVVQGSSQGIYIKVNGSRNGSNNFLTFADDYGIWGRVEGQTFPELEQTWQYKLQVQQFAFQAVALAGQIAAFTAKAIGEGASLFAAGAIAGTVLQIATLVIQTAALLTESISWGVNIRTYIGVTYSSGAGDYAEWLPRSEGERDVHFGEVVGVRGGKVSLNTTDADHFMVVSSQPAVIGNKPQPGQESNFEKIAFMGQVPVKVAGPVAVGDFIITSGNHDGFGVAIHPKNMKTGDYARVVGVAWEAAPEQPINFVKVAVGINTNDLSNKVDELNKEVENIMAFLEGKSPLLDAGEIAATTPPIKPQTTFQKLYTDEEYDAYIDQNAGFLKGLFTQVKATMIKQGTDLSMYPQVTEFLDDPVTFMKAIRRDPAYLTHWSLVDQNFKNAKIKK